MTNETDPLLIEFLDARRRKQSTKREYANRVLKYCEFLDKTPTELIEEAEEDQINYPLIRQRRIKEYLLNFRENLDSSDVVPTYVNDVMAIVKAFYRQFEITLPEISNTTKEDDNQRPMTMDDLPSLEDLEIITEKASLKNKAIILLGISSGMGSAELRSLKVSDYFKAHNVNIDENTDILEVIRDKIDESHVPTWHIKRIKTGMPYYTFSSPESNKAINNYLKYKLKKYKEYWEKLPLLNGVRKRNTERAMNNIKTTEDTYLFDVSGGYMKDVSFTMSIGRLNDSCGFGKVGKQRYFHSHIMRKIFSSTVVNNGMELTDANWLLGHKIHKMSDIYTKPSINRLKQEYLRVLPFLSIEEVETLTLESDEYKALREENEALRAQFADIQSKLPELKELKDLLSDPEIKQFIENRVK